MAEGHSFPSSDSVVCTLFEGDFFFGVATLINSIVRGGFAGLFWVGYRGSLPGWVSQLQRRDDGLFVVANAQVGFEELHETQHFGQYKAEFMRSLIDRGIASKHLWYFDPDITVRCSWGFYERWVRFGISVCQDLNMSAMAPDHPIRLEWLALSRAAGWGEPIHVPAANYNSGFIGMDVSQSEMLDLWIKAVRLANAQSVAASQFQKGDRSQTFYTVDQDTLNLALMYTPSPLSTIGPEGMGWIYGGFTMYHSLGRLKPWRKQFIRAAIDGHSPSNADKHYLQCADRPIAAYSGSKLKRLRLQSLIATFIGRFYRRR